MLLKKETAEEILECASDQLVTPTRKLSAAVFAGGYPLPALAPEASFRTRWFDGYVQTYLERDLRDLSSTDNLVEFRRFMRICAAQNGRLLNIASLANDAGLSPATARRYLNILEISFQVTRIPA